MRSIRSSRRAYMIGVTVGQTNIFFFDADGQQIAGFDIAVTRDLNGVRAALKQTLPDADIRIEGVGDGVVLSGSAASPAKRSRPSISPRGWSATAPRSSTASPSRPRPGHAQGDGRRSAARRHQAARHRSDRQLNYGTAVVNFNTSNPFSGNGQPLEQHAIRPARSTACHATLRAMERAGVIRTLAEPNLTAISGETANFHRRRRIPDPERTVLRHHQVAADLPTADRVQEIRRQPDLHAGRAVGRPHQPQGHDRSVRSLDRKRDDAVQVPGSTQTLTIPSIQTRRAETTVEIPSGGSLAMAGMIQEQTKQQINGLPGLMQIADPRHAVQEPRLRQPPDRTDGAGDALYRARGRAEGSVAAR